MKRFLSSSLSLVAALVLAACADSGPTSIAGAPDGQTGMARAITTQSLYNIFTTQTPSTTLDASPGWEVGTQFYSDTTGCIIGLRFWKAAGETGTNRLKLWTNSGTRLATVSDSTSGTGWHDVYFPGYVCISKNTYYRVSVNTNVKQVKSFGVFSGPVVNGPLHGTSGYYGQPIDNIPTTATSSGFFVDVIYEPN